MPDTPSPTGAGGLAPPAEPAPPQVEHEPPAARGGRYEIQAVLGQGGFGTVFQACYRGEGGFSKEVAVKVLHGAGADDPDLARRLRDEARLLGLLRHRAIVQVDRLVHLADQWAVVMELVDGLDLGLLSQRLGVPPRVALEVAAEVADALDVAFHTSGPEGRPLELVHRDVKPGNVLVTRYGDVKLLDLGIARAELADREAVTHQLTYGSPGYMSPERLDHQDGPAGDIYALGVVILELILGEAMGRTSAVRERHDNHVFPKLEQLWQHLGEQHEGIVELVGMMLAWEPEIRPGPKDVARRCRALAEQVGGEDLREWAEASVGPLLAEVRADQRRLAEQAEVAGEVLHDDLASSDTGAQTDGSETMFGFMDDAGPQGSGPVDDALDESVLVDGAGSRPDGTWDTIDPTPEPAPDDGEPKPGDIDYDELTGTALEPVVPPDSAGLRPSADVVAKAIKASHKPPQDERKGPSLVAMAIGLAVVAGAVGGLAAGLLGGDRDSSAAEQVAAEAPSALPELAEIAGDVAENGDAAAEPGALPSAPGAAPGSGADFAAAAGSTTPAGAAPSGNGDGVSVTGDAEAVFLVSPMAQYRVPGPVPAGSYEIEAIFLGIGRVTAGEIDVGAGAAPTIRCAAARKRCAVE